MQRTTSFRSGPVKSRLTYMQFRKIKRRRVGEIDRLPTVSTALSQHMERAPAFSTKEQNFAHFCALYPVALVETLSLEAGRKQTRTLLK